MRRTILCLFLFAAAAPAGETATRADLSLAFMRFEAALLLKPPGRGLLINVVFDRATFGYYGPGFAKVVEQLDALTERLTHRPVPALQVRARPWVSVRGEKIEFLVKRIYGERRLWPLRIMDRAGRAILQKEVGDGSVVTLEGAKPGEYRILLGEHPVGHCFVATVPVDAVRRVNRVRLDGYPGPAAEACRARNELLRSEFSEEVSARFMALPTRLAAEVDAEIEAIAKGRNPYRDRRGLYWRTIGSNPAWVFAPKEGLGTKPPLVVALHGEGGDEGMFVYAYGAGLLVRLARRLGFVAVMPRTDWIARDPQVFDAIVAMARRNYDIGRVYVLGHARGGRTAGELTRMRPGIGAALCIAGAGRFSDTVPITVVAGALDAIVKPEQLAKLAEGKANVRFLTIAGTGHTLIVHGVLGQGIEWLLAQEKKPRTE